MRISDWSSDVCSSDLNPAYGLSLEAGLVKPTQPTACSASLRRRSLIRPSRLLELRQRRRDRRVALEHVAGVAAGDFLVAAQVAGQQRLGVVGVAVFALLAFGLEHHVRLDAARLDRLAAGRVVAGGGERSDEAPSELQSLMRISF